MCVCCICAEVVDEDCPVCRQRIVSKLKVFQ